MLGDVKIAQEFSRRLFEHNVFAMAIGFPTVPMGKARIRAMISATHSEQDLDYGIDKFIAVANEVSMIPDSKFQTKTV
jgi:glycine C-acetyltransferase